MKIREALLVALFIVCILPASGQNTDLKRLGHFNLEKGLAIQGYDPVAYFVVGNAVQGSKTITYEYRGVKYMFANASNRDLFKSSPEKYEPQYGGWCAYAMGASGEKVEVDPETFKIIDQKLYLFYNAYFNNTLKKWNSDEKGLKLKADQNWLTIYK